MSVSSDRSASRAWFHRALRAVGLEVRLVRNVERHDQMVYEDKWRRDWLMFQGQPIRTILDIGANTGQFATMIHAVCPDAAIHAFEPISACIDELRGALGKVPRSTLHPYALGDMDGTTTMNRSLYTPCSSMLMPNDRMAREYPDGARVQPESVTVRRLDDVVDEIACEPDMLVKIDVQGYELHVLRGAVQTLKRARWLVIEVTFRAQYEGQPLFDEIYQAVRALGFVYRGCAGQYLSPMDGQWQYADAVLERKT